MYDPLMPLSERRDFWVTRMTGCGPLEVTLETSRKLAIHEYENRCYEWNKAMDIQHKTDDELMKWPDGAAMIILRDRFLNEDLQYPLQPPVDLDAIECDDIDDRQCQAENESKDNAILNGRPLTVNPCSLFADPIDRDGNCLPECFAQQAPGYDNQQRVRNEIADYFEVLGPDAPFCQGFDGSDLTCGQWVKLVQEGDKCTFAEYVQKIRQPGFYLGQLEMRAWSKKNGSRVTVYAPVVNHTNNTIDVCPRETYYNGNAVEECGDTRPLDAIVLHSGSHYHRLVENANDCIGAGMALTVEEMLRRDLNNNYPYSESLYLIIYCDSDLIVF